MFKFTRVQIKVFKFTRVQIKVFKFKLKNVQVHTCQRMLEIFKNICIEDVHIPQQAGFPTFRLFSVLASMTALVIDWVYCGYGPGGRTQVCGQ